MKETQNRDGIKPITGTWLNFQWPDARYRHMNAQQAAFTCADWELKVSEMAEIGIEYLVFQSVAQKGKAFYRSAFMPGAGLACDDPLGAVMRAAEKRGLKVFLSCEFVNDEDDDISDPGIMETRLAIMRELSARFGASPAFYGWYFSAEGDASLCFGAPYVEYVNTLAARARRLTPGAKILIAPKGLRSIRWNKQYVAQLRLLNVDIVAYQDKVGCVQSPDPFEFGRVQFAGARKMHDQVPHIALWADIELFSWEGRLNSRDSALIPAPFPRVLEQMAAVSPHVGRKLAFTALGMLDKPGSRAPTGHSTAQEQYRLYERYLSREDDMLILADAIAGHVRHAAIGALPILNSNAAGLDPGWELVNGSTANTGNQKYGYVAFKDGAMDVTIDLGKRVKLKYVGVHLIADHFNGVFLPEKVSFSVSTNGEKFVSIGDAEPYPWCPSIHDIRREILVSPRTRKKARYVRIVSQGVRIPNNTAPRDTAILASEIIINPEKRWGTLERPQSAPPNQPVRSSPLERPILNCPAFKSIRLEPSPR